MSCVEREIVLPVPRDEAWEMVTEADWLGDEVEFEAEEGAPVRDGDRAGLVERVEPEERIVFTWGDSRVVWTLDDAPGGTRFTVTETRESFAWGPRLTALASAAALCPA